MSDHEARKGKTGPAKRAPETPPMGDQPDRMDAETLDRRDAAKSSKRRPAGPPMDEEVPAGATAPDVPPATLDEQ